LNGYTPWAIKRATLFLTITLALLERLLRIFYQWKPELIIVYIINGMMTHKYVTLHVTKVQRMNGQRLNNLLYYEMTIYTVFKNNMVSIFLQ